MDSDRIKEIQETTAYPESISVKQALLQVWNECEQEQVKNCFMPDVIKLVCVKCDTDMIWNGLLEHWFCPNCKIQVNQTVL